MIKLDYYVTNKGIIVANRHFNYGSVRSNLNRTPKINGKPLENTHNSYWYFVEGEEEIVSYEIKSHDTRNLVKYELKDKGMFVEGKIPKEFSPDEVKEYYCEEHECMEWEFHSNLCPLYRPVYESIEGKWEECEFEARCLGEVEGDITALITTEFKVAGSSGWDNRIESVDISKIVHYSELDTILAPEFAIHNKPCSISSKQTYNIIRTFLKDNIDPKQAQITSDYDFCFTVKKKVGVKPWVHRREEKKANGKSYARPRIKTQTVEHKLVEIFEMTNTESNYEGYTPIKGFSGKSLEDLVKNIKSFLQELLDVINRPVSECKVCNGTGHIIDNDFQMNKREEE